MGRSYIHCTASKTCYCECKTRGSHSSPLLSFPMMNVHYYNWLRNYMVIQQNYRPLSTLTDARGSVCLSIVWYHLYRFRSDIHCTVSKTHYCNWQMRRSYSSPFPSFSLMNVWHSNRLRNFTMVQPPASRNSLPDSTKGLS